MKPLHDINMRLKPFAGLQTSNAKPGKDRLSDLATFGSNPGQLRARVYIPESLRKGAPLVVVLHGCTQTAAGYDHGSGWSSLADQCGFGLLYPEQQRSNNPNLCFNWFVPRDCRRGAGEPLSIREMIEAFAIAHGTDRSRIFITGLSAGGAMTSVMLATYPEVFAGGAIIAGLPYGCATTMPQAFERMRGQGGPVTSELQFLLREASDHAGPWPTISVWHGSADQTVSPTNAEAILAQWRAVHGFGEMPARVESGDGYSRRIWCDARGREHMEMYTIAGMGHGTPLQTSGDEGCGAAGPFMLDGYISSTRRISHFWGLAASPHVYAKQSTTPSVSSSLGQGIASIQKTITDALRAAGLMR